MTTTQHAGSIGWHDLTTGMADDLRDFYAEVCGWTPEAHDMGGYADYVMKTPDGAGVAGVCHARGTNADLPPQWLMYVTVTDLDAKVAACTTRGGRIVAGPKSMGESRYCIIADPAGAVCALYEPAG